MSEIVCTFKIEEESQRKLKQIANENDRSLSAQIRVILEGYLDKRS